MLVGITENAEFMRPDQPHNIAIVEFLHNGEPSRIIGQAATEKDDAIQIIVDRMAQEGITGERILRLYSERKPSPEWYAYFARHWPNAAVTWSFGPGQNAEMETAIDAFTDNVRGGGASMEAD